jgi:uncharacterized membrane protein
MSKTLIAIVAIALIVAITIWVVKRCCARCDQRQFPSAYTLLKSSPGIDRRETQALWAIVALSVLWFLLLLTSAL